jgi:hypothetical protein
VPPPFSLKDEFSKARGLTSYEVEVLSIQRVSCERYLFAPSGHVIEGDADLKATAITSDLIMVEMPSHFSFVAFGGVNEFNNGIIDMDSGESKQVVRIHPWVEGASLKLRKAMTASFEEENKKPETIWADDEIRVREDAYSKVLLVKETVFAKKPFHLYMICR